MTVTDEQLGSLLICRGEPLDINGTLIDFGPRFFEPAIPPDGLAEFCQAVDSHWFYQDEDPWNPGYRHLGWKPPCVYDEEYPGNSQCGRLATIECGQKRHGWMDSVLGHCLDHLDDQDLDGEGKKREYWEVIDTNRFEGWIHGYLPGFAELGPVRLARGDKLKFRYHYISTWLTSSEPSTARYSHMSRPLCSTRV
ncbi:hypothetical protein QBC35DRAFT_474620 [Podospora australis]|uniref:Uncharacterized protein n=1 Tax=Podospora australis TaxID=1536484 RepID=A0AAN6WTG7_9PEZI|nr:hypothetical protein QBC35DRAFT_474620 [Podospora australis]